MRGDKDCQGWVGQTLQLPVQELRELLWEVAEEKKY